MNFLDIIHKKREGIKLTKAEIDYMISAYTAGDIPDYQMASFLMAVHFRSMDREETFNMTMAMLHSGDTADLSEIEGIKVDKHSTGGVGDKTTLIIGPIVAACGVPVAKMSGRGLGFTGGTVDKLESIPGFRTQLEPKEFKENVNQHKISVIGQSQFIKDGRPVNMVPADKKLYALRDATDTVEDIGLITSSIMSKKLASGCNALLLDVKCGHGAFMKDEEDARELGKWMVRIGKNAGVDTMAVISDMSQPLGCTIGNSIEVLEAIDVLKGNGPEDLKKLSLTIAGQMIKMGGKADTFREGKKLANHAIKDGTALEKFREFVEAQGGNPDITEYHSLMPQPKYTLELKSPSKGFISELNAETVGIASRMTGAGRLQKEDVLDLSAGITLKHKVSDFVMGGDVLAVLQGNSFSKLEEAAKKLAGAYKFSKKPVEKPWVVIDIIK